MSADDLILTLPAEEYDRRCRRENSKTPELWSSLDAVKDPEIPTVSIWELGILQDLKHDSGHIKVVITPTYSGCPAMDVITEDIVSTLNTEGYMDVEIVTCLAPAWSSSWMLPSAKAALRSLGIVAPVQSGADISCPQCGSTAVVLVSEFGSTACKAQYRCQRCAEPFDYFKML